MMQQFLRLLRYPDSILKHPLFRHDTRRMAWAVSEVTLRAYSLRVARNTALIVFVLWLTLTMLAYALSPSSNPYDLLGRLPQAGLDALLLMIIGAILLNLLLDGICMRAAARALRDDLSRERWDLLRLTALNAWGITQAKQAAGELRSWRIMVIVVASRGTVAGILFGLLVVLLMLSGDLFPMLRSAPAEVVLFGLQGLLVVAIYTLEPYWRMKAVVALGLMIASRIVDTSLGLLASVGAVFVLWLVQWIILITLLIGLSFASPFLLFGSVLAVHLCLWLALLVVGATIYGFYNILLHAMLRRVIARLSRDK